MRTVVRREMVAWALAAVLAVALAVSLITRPDSYDERLHRLVVACYEGGGDYSSLFGCEHD